MSIGVLLWLRHNKPHESLTHIPTILMVFNGKHVYEAENAFASIKQNVPELASNIKICVSDDYSLEFAKKHNLSYFQLSQVTDTGEFFSIPMNIMTRRKLECVLTLLENQEDVLYFDTDVVFLKNPLNEINQNYDINIQSDECTRPYKRDQLCTGFMYFKSNPHNIEFINEIIDQIVFYDYKIPDQNALENIAKSKKLLKWYGFKRPSINILDVCKFPNGCRYFNNTDKECTQSQALIIHNNHIVGLQNKYVRFKNNNLLFSESEYCGF